MTVRLAFTGTGYISKIHAQAARNLNGVRREAVVNHQAESMIAFAKEHEIARMYPDVDALLADGGVDALVISTPNYLHAREAIAALRSGVHVMVEKPMAMDASEAREMVEASVESGSHLMVAHCWRFDDEVLWLRDQVAEGRLGNVIRTKGYGVHVNWGPSGWFTEKDLAGGGSVPDMGIHAIDTARFLLGDPAPVSVYANIGTYYKDMEVDDTGVILITWEDGSVSYIEAGWWQPYADGRCASTQLYGRKAFGQTFPTRLVLPADEPFKTKAIDPGFPERSKHAPQRMYDAQLQYFLNCIRSGETPNPGGQEGLTNMRIVDGAYESSRTGQVVLL